MGFPTANLVGIDTLVPAVGASLIAVTSTSVFGWFVSWISSVAILDLCGSELCKGDISLPCSCPLSINNVRAVGAFGIMRGC
jgi:hypothetical protein